MASETIQSQAEVMLAPSLPSLYYAAAKRPRRGAFWQAHEPFNLPRSAVDPTLCGVYRIAT